MKIKIENKFIGEDSPCFIVAEVGINHNGDINIAKKMIDVSAEAGCDAVKFQNFKAELMYPKSAGKLDWEDEKGKYSYDIFENVKKFEYPEEWIDELKEYCKKKNIIFFSSASDEESADLLYKKGVKLFKTTSYAITHLPLIEYIAKKGLPIIMSTGGSNLQEIKEAYEIVRKYDKKIAILHCVAKYPTPLEYANLNVIDTLKKEFPEAIIGYSDHTEGPVKAPVAAIVKGAKVIEKHITLDRKMKGPDHFFALEPNELKEMVKAIRNTEKRLKKGEKIKIDNKILGSSERKTYEIEKYLRNFAYSIIFTKKEIKKGELFTKDNLIILRKGKKEKGLEPKEWFNIINKKRANKDLKVEHVLKKEDLN